MLDAPVALRVGLLVTLFEQAPSLPSQALLGHMKQTREFIISQLRLAAPPTSGIPTVIRAGGLVPRRPDPHAAESKASHRRAVAVPLPVPVARVGALSVAAAARAIADLYRSLIDGGRLRNASRPDAARVRLVGAFLRLEFTYLNQRHLPSEIRRAVTQAWPQVEAALKNEVTLAQLPPSR